MYPYRFKITLIIFIIFLSVSSFVSSSFKSWKAINTKVFPKIAVLLRIHLRPHEGLSSTETERSLAVDQHTFDIAVQYKNLLYRYVRDNNAVSRIDGMKAHKNAKKTCGECHENQDAWVNKLSQLLEFHRTSC